jgi:Ca-activated chloride channel homolog
MTDGNGFRRCPVRNGSAAFFALVFMFWYPLACQAQGVLLPEDQSFRIPRQRGGQVEEAYRIRELTVDAAIKNQIASTQVTQVFENTSGRTIQASFVFPIPYDGAVSQMTFLVDGKEYEAKLLPADEARRIYEGYVRRNQDPALLEWVGLGMFKTSVFPIPAGATRTVTLKYAQLLRKQSRATDYLFPLATARYTSRPLEKLSLRVAIQSDQKISNIYSPTHLVDIKRDDEFNATVTHSSSSKTPTTDFRLVFDSTSEKIGVSLMSYWPKGDDAGYFILLASPELKAADGEPVKKQVLFVVDQSGSMSGEKIQQARDAAKFVLNNLRENDLFNLISYDSEVKPMSPELQRFNSESRQTALGFINSINAGGMTNIDGALKAAMAMIQTDQHPSYLVFLTDGLPTVGETNELKIAQACQSANQHGTRVISFGVGYDVNSRLLDRLSRDNNGQSEYVSPEENVEASVARLYAKLAAPVLSKIQMDYHFEGLSESEGKPVDRMYPKKVTDMFAGGQIVLVGRYRKSGPLKIKISGDVNGKNETYQFDGNLVEASDSSSTNHMKYVAQLWASRRIGEIIDLIDLNGKKDELVNELVELSKKWGIVTPYTSFLADDQADPRILAQRGRLNALSSSELDHLSETSGQYAFGYRSNKQFFKESDLATPQANLELQASRNADGSQLGSRSGGAGVGGMQAGRGAGSGGNSNPLGRGEKVESASGKQGMRQVGSVTIYVRGNTLVADNAVDVELENNSKIVEIKRFSDAYFDLVASNSSEGNLILAEQREGEILVATFRGTTYRIN